MQSHQIENELIQYLRLLLDFNPIFFTLLVVAMVTSVVYIFNKHIMAPFKIKFIREKQKLEYENTRLMALFAELDPDPVIRINDQGLIIQSNKAAEFLFKPQSIIGNTVSLIVPEIKDVNSSIAGSLTQVFYRKIKEKHYLITLRGIQELKFAQLYFRDITERKLNEEQLKDYSVRLQKSIEVERKRIARELHDGVGQTLSLARFKTQILSSQMPDKKYSNDFSEIKQTIEMSIKELKDISWRLKPGILDEIGLEPTIMTLCNNTSKISLIQGEFRYDEHPRISGEKETCIFRIVQEALGNIVKHSQAKEFSVRLMYDDGKIRLIITDNGIGFNAEELVEKRGTEKTIGLISMRERAENAGGTFEIESSREEGTMVIAEIPIEGD